MRQVDAARRKLLALPLTFHKLHFASSKRLDYWRLRQTESENLKQSDYHQWR